jgi:hypothetical protein
MNKFHSCREGTIEDVFRSSIGQVPIYYSVRDATRKGGDARPGNRQRWAMASPREDSAAS